MERGGVGREVLSSLSSPCMQSSSRLRSVTVLQTVYKRDEAAPAEPPVADLD